MTDTTEVDDLVKQWDEYVESMGSVMGEVEHMAQQMADSIDALAAKLDAAELRERQLLDTTATCRMLRREFNTLKAKLAEVEAERDAFASNIPDAAQNLIRNAHTGRLKALHRVKAAEARIAHLENHIEAVAKDTHKIMVNLASPLDDPRVKALVVLINRAQDIIDPCYPAKHAVWQNDTRAALSALEEKQMTDKNLDIMTRELIYSDFTDTLITYRFKGIIEDCFSYLDTINNMEDNEYLLTDYQDNIEMIRACVKVLQWFTMDNYDETLREVNKYALKVEEMFG